MRKIVQIGLNVEGVAACIHGAIVALCDDGALWILLLDHDDKGKPFQAWKRLPDIPQEGGAE